MADLDPTLVDANQIAEAMGRPQSSSKGDSSMSEYSLSDLIDAHRYLSGLVPADPVAAVFGGMSRQLRPVSPGTTRPYDGIPTSPCGR